MNIIIVRYDPIKEEFSSETIKVDRSFGDAHFVKDCIGGWSIEVVYLYPKHFGFQWCDIYEVYEFVSLDDVFSEEEIRKIFNQHLEEEFENGLPTFRARNNPSL